MLKLLTINLHSYVEENWQIKLDNFTDYITSALPDVVAMQEVNQTLDSPFCGLLTNCFSVDYDLPLRKDNYGLKVSEILKRKNCNYHYVWLGIKESYGRFEEGLGFLLKEEPLRIKPVLLSRTTDKANWKKRMALGVKSGGVWFYNLHMGRWDDKEEPFIRQWSTFCHSIPKDEKTVLMGDFNAPSDALNEGYASVISTGWLDTYTLASQKDEGFTVRGKIDGWNDSNSSKRIDYVFVNFSCDVASSHTVFNGECQNVISDHFGIEVYMEG